MSQFLRYREEPIRLHSGSLSHYEIIGDAMFEDESIRELVLAYWRQQIPYNDKTDIVGVPNGGTSWAAALASSQKHFNYLHLTPTTSDDVRARLAARRGGQLIVVDDILTTGASVLAFQRADLYLAVVDRSIRGLNNVQCWARLPLPIFVKEKASE